MQEFFFLYFWEMKKEEVKYILNLFSTDVISEIEKGMKATNCNLCAQGYFESAVIVKKRLSAFIEKIEVSEMSRSFRNV